jgi:hypothetical protein
MTRKSKVGRFLRLVASEGWADEDAEVVAELLEAARKLAELVVGDDRSSAEARAAATDLLDRLHSDSYASD